MERRKTTEDKYRFKDLEHLTRWLVSTKWGQGVMRDAIQSQHCSELVREMVERELATSEAKPVPAYVLVRAYGDGWIEVYGPKHVRARVVELPATESAEQEKLIDDWVSLNVRLPYQQIDHPSNRRATGYVPPYLGFGEFVNGLVDRDVATACIEGCRNIQ